MAVLSPSAELMVDPQSGARCAIRDTGAPEAECYFWTVTVLGYHLLAAGRTPELAEARSLAEAGGVDYTAAWREMSRDRDRSNDDLGRSQRRLGRLGCRLFARTGRQGRVALAVRQETEIHGPVLAAFSPSPDNARCLVEQRSPGALPLKIVS